METLNYRKPTEDELSDVLSITPQGILQEEMEVEDGIFIRPVNCIVEHIIFGIYFDFKYYYVTRGIRW